MSKGSDGRGVQYFADNKTRKCLRCQKQFKSSGPQNRICGRCVYPNQCAYEIALVDTNIVQRAIRFNSLKNR